MWEENKLELLLRQKLHADLTKSEADTLYGNYLTARDALLKQILDEIKSREPNLTDHGPRHIADVMDNVHRLIRRSGLNGQHLFLVTISALYHDVGNIFGRTEHENNLLKVFNDTYPKTGTAYRRIKSLVNTIAGAHTGKSLDGSKDTLKELSSSDTFMKDTVNPRELAAVLRFADELAEGKHRTSDYKIKHKLIPNENLIYHAYASLCEPAVIDDEHQRIALTYPISIEERGEALYIYNQDIKLEKMLEYIYSRIHKLDLERKYCKHYAPSILNHFIQVSAVFEFWLDDDEQLHFDKNPLELNDLISMDTHVPEIIKTNPSFSPNTIINSLKEQINDNS